MGRSFHKEMSVYLETRAVRRTVLYYLGFKRKVKLYYNKGKRVALEYCDKFWHLFFPKPTISQNLAQERVHIYHKEVAPAVAWVRGKIEHKRAIREEKRREKHENIDVRLIEKTIQEHRVR